MRSRSILDEIHLIRNIIDYCNQKNVPCILLDLDQEKAFDRVNHKFLAKALAHFGFKQNFIEWVKILYTNVSSCVLVNNFVSSPIRITRGVRQGCPLLPLLYVLYLETFANQIRLDNNIHGLSLPGSTLDIKISLYADDTNGIVTDDRSAELFLHKALLFNQASGSKLNLGKVE